MAATTAQSGAAQEAGRPQPQTTVEPAGGPFIRHSQPGRRAQYSQTNQAFGGLITQPLVAVPGYVRGFRVSVTASGGVNGTKTVATAADAPYNAIQQVTLKDAFGTPLIVAPGYEALYLVPKFGGAFGLGDARDVSNLPSYSAPSVGSTGTGNFSFSSQLPLEFVKGYGVISGANASLLPNLTWNLAPATSVYTTTPGTLPVLEVDVDSDFYWLPEGVSVEPPGLGTTQQWVYQQCNPPIPSNSTMSVQLPRLGGYLSTIILELRDSTGARIDAWPNRLRMYVDGVPLIDSTFDEIQDDMYNVYEGTSRPTGVLAISRKTSLSQVDMGQFDTGETYLSTNPGTLLEFEGAPWGAITNAPANLNVIVGQVVPSGTLIQGLSQV